MKYFVLGFIFLFSCGEGVKTLPSSTGVNSEIIFVVDDSLWELEIKSLVRNIFCSPIQGLNQNESLFRTVQINHREFKSTLKTHKNIVIISEEAKTQSYKNKWAKQQVVIYFGSNQKRDDLEKNLKKIRDIFILKEVKSIREDILKTSQKEIEKQHKLNFKTNCIIPQEYEIIKNNKLFFWANYDPPNSDEIKNIITFSFRPKSANLQKEVLQKTDSVLAKYLVGKKEGSYVRIEPEYPPYYFENTYRGLWKLENGFMGGAFLLKTYFVAGNLVVNAGLIFAPQNRKRKYIKEFESIL